jgi:hypothetical protein
VYSSLAAARAGRLAWVIRIRPSSALQLAVPPVLLAPELALLSAAEPALLDAAELALRLLAELALVVPTLLLPALALAESELPLPPPPQAAKSRLSSKASVQVVSGRRRRAVRGMTGSRREGSAGFCRIAVP